MSERVVQFGAGASLVGILTDPPATERTGRLAVLLLNAGELHRIGPHRVNVKLARRLAATGHIAFRFDFSGLGDSGPRRDGLPYPDSAVREARDAMDYLSSAHGMERFVFVGFCGGADNAFRVACADTRVCGAFLLDWFPYRTLGWYRRQLGALLGRAVRDRMRSGTAQRTAAELGDLVRLATTFARDPGRLDRRVPALRQAAAQLGRVLDRGAWLRFVYTGGQRRYFNGASQFREMFGRLALHPRVRVDYWADADHMLTLLAWQETMIREVERWLAIVSDGQPSIVPRRQHHDCSAVS